MNTLSWFLYFAGLVYNLKVSLVIMLFACVPIGGVCLFYYSEAADETSQKKAAFYLKTVFTTFIVLLGCVAFIPSNETVYAIAASEFGESILTSEAGQQVLSALKEWTLSQLKTK